MLILSACSSSKPNASGSKSTAASSSVPALSGDPILLGQMAPTGTPTLDYADMKATAKAAVDGINKSGGINGRPLQVLFCNENANANDALACAREFVNKKIIAYVGGLSVTGEAQIAQLMAQAGIPMIGNNDLSANYKSADSFPVVGGHALSTYASVPACAQENKNKISIAAVDDALSQTFIKLWEDSIAKAKGVTLVNQPITIPADATDLTAQARALMNNGTECIVTSLREASTVLLMRALSQFGYTGKLLFSGAVLSANSLSQQADNLNKIGLAIQWFPPLTAASQYASLRQLQADLTAARAGGDNNAPSPDDFIRDPAMLAWVAVQAAAAAMKQTKAYTAADLAAALPTLKDVQVVDFLPPWTPANPGGTPGYVHLPAEIVYYTVGFQAGKGVLVPPNQVNIRPFLPVS
ncbi:ABC transporter substrate-binding protein [Streptomyces sp. NPDC051219]|uniref:ABC transporter substrate-binding protein n=1 Tax=Streptomyces sp. NPDC051219 TaxID=3155283 RepID=UPI00343D231E